MAGNNSNFDVHEFRSYFPIFDRTFHGKTLAYLDSGATSLKPKPVVDRIEKFYNRECSNVHRGLYQLSEEATLNFEAVRDEVVDFIGAEHREEIIFTKGTTDSINLLCQSLGLSSFFQEGDEILVSQMEHHSNIVPWQMLCERMKMKLQVIPMNEKGELVQEAFDKLLSEKTKLLSITYVSNSLGTINPVKEMIQKAHSKGIPVMIDGAQAVGHFSVSVKDLDCDFLAFSAHKMFGPNGVGVLYGKKKYLLEMPPVQGGGDMIRSVRFEKTTYHDIPYRFEAGTPNVAGVIGLGEALKFLKKFPVEDMKAYLEDLTSYGLKVLKAIPGLKIIGESEKRSSILSFVLDAAHPHDIGTLLDREGVAVRAGHHCTQPVMEFFKVPATARASLHGYNLQEELDRLVVAIQKVKEMFE